MSNPALGHRLDKITSRGIQKFINGLAGNGMRVCDVHSMHYFHALLLIFAGVDPANVSADLPEK